MLGSIVVTTRELSTRSSHDTAAAATSHCCSSHATRKNGANLLQ